jgi:dienelactone hydrolase
VLTSAHVVADAATVTVRFDADRPGQWQAIASVGWCDTGTVAVVYGAAHMPAVVQTLVGRLGYRPERGGEWLLAVDF